MLLAVDLGPILRRVDGHKKFRRGRLTRYTAAHLEGFAGRELGIHPRRGDSHSLLAARLRELVEFRAVKQLAEDASELVFHNTRAIVFDGHAEHVVSFLRNLDPDFGQDAGLLAGIERVIDGLLDGGQSRLGQRIKAEQVAVLEKELRNRNVALASRHLVGDVGMERFALIVVPR